MNNIVILVSLSGLLFSLFKPLSGTLMLISWFVSCGFIYLFWSAKFALVSFVAAVSFYLTDLSHLNPFYSKLFPFICGLFSSYLFLALVSKLYKENPPRGGTGYSDSGSSYSGSFDGGGCDGGGSD